MGNRNSIISSSTYPARIFSGKKGDIGGEFQSAIVKHPIEHATHITTCGLTNDEQADSEHHGGVDRAICHFPAEHYKFWSEIYPDISSIMEPSLFGENISTNGIDEKQVCIGDIWQVGTCVLEVTQPRSPCWKLNYLTGISDFSKNMQDTGRTGWLYRVIEAGTVKPEDSIQLIVRPYSDFTVRKVLNVFYNDRKNNEMEELTQLIPLAKSWKNKIHRRMKTGLIEDWSSRLTGF